ncbi:MAG: hypothetical protein RLZZ504_595 [Bacteroidota bacterium]
MNCSVFIYITFIFMMLQSCTITKRYHTRGVNFQWHGNYTTKNKITPIIKQANNIHPKINLGTQSHQSEFNLKPSPTICSVFIDTITKSYTNTADSLSPELIKLRRTKQLANSFAIAAGASFSGAGLIIAAVPNRGPKSKNAVWGFIAAILMFPVVLLFIILYSITMRRYRKLLKNFQSS